MNFDIKVDWTINCVHNTCLCKKKFQMLENIDGYLFNIWLVSILYNTQEKISFQEEFR